MAVTKVWYKNQAYALQTNHHQETQATVTIHSSQPTSHICTILAWRPLSHTLFFKIDNTVHKAHVIHATQKNNRLSLVVYVFQLSKQVTLDLHPPTITASPTQLTTCVMHISSPLSGRIVRLLVQQGDTIKKDQPLLVIESMKMENEIRAPHDTFIKTILIKESDVVELGQILLIFEDEERKSHARAKNENG